MVVVVVCVGGGETEEEREILHLISGFILMQVNGCKFQGGGAGGFKNITIPMVCDNLSTSYPASLLKYTLHSSSSHQTQCMYY